jgi:predicted HTH domain antitoxin
MVIEDELLEAARMSEPEIRLELAIALYQLEKFTLGQAARLAVLSQSRMRHALAARGISPHYGVGDFEHDLNTLRRPA